ncbi:unnamed protein product [Rotaria magnacalcarata]|uniref:Uncharacterized protein n=7 Tax=Rotaria magnacalcarata TaxID=392030 RepID=A0A816PY35_9BILA|nr:unnamed protein product [Rotaria magnacalcarata]CAF3792799.1 unnamed protein product [Rotaria magnacalcarata]
MSKKLNKRHGIYKNVNLTKILRAQRNARYRANHPSMWINPLLVKQEQLQKTTTARNETQELTTFDLLSMNRNQSTQNDGNDSVNISSMDTNEFIDDDDGDVTMVKYEDDESEIDIDFDEPVGYTYNENDISYSSDESDDAEIDPEIKYNGTKLSSRDIAVMLCLIKRRHKCTNELIIDIIQLLMKIVPDPTIIPTSIYEIRKLLNINARRNKEDKQLSTTVIICQSCETIQVSNKKCSKRECNSQQDYLRKPYTYTWFNIQQQFEEIVTREKKLAFPSNTNTTSPPTSLTDITDGRLYRHFLNNEISDDVTILFTLSLSTDGVQIGLKSTKSLWLITLTINEIDVKNRFLLHNVVIGGINSCLKKPTRRIMSLMIEPIVQQLQRLEQGAICQFDDETLIYKVFLLGSINDKPANSLLQNIPEPNAAFGCSKCEIQGITTLSNPLLATNAKQKRSTTKTNKKETHRIRVFPTSFANTPARLRSSENYKLTMEEIENERLNNPGLTDEQEYQLRKGYLGPCQLDRLAYFDQGQGFLSDTLHTVYGGALRKLLSIFFERKYCTQEKRWTIVKEMAKINERMQQFITPSSTVRLPRNINIYHRFKASEYRSILLLYYKVFENSLPSEYYCHLKQLVFAMHIGENKEISKEKLDGMHLLLQYHVHQFKVLYGNRHVVNTVHSLIHFGETVRDYGPLQGYSTFNYESILGAITSTVNGTKNEEKEIYNNLQILKQSSFFATQSQNSKLYGLMIKLLGKKYQKEETEDGRFKLRKLANTNSEKRIYFDESCLNKTLKKSYNRCTYNNIKYDSYNIGKKDCAILYRDTDNDKLQYAVISKFIQFEDKDDPLLFQVYDLINWHYDYLYIGTTRYDCDNVSIGELNKDPKEIHPSTVIEKVFLYTNADELTFIRLPNLTESS